MKLTDYMKLKFYSIRKIYINLKFKSFWKMILWKNIHLLKKSSWLKKIITIKIYCLKDIPS